MVARRRHKKFQNNFVGIILVFIVIIGITIGGLFIYKSRIDAQMGALVELCKDLPEDYETIKLSGDEGNVKYSFSAPSYLEGNFEEGEEGDYYFAIDEEGEKSIFYVYVFTKDEPSNYSDEVKMHLSNAGIYDAQPIQNNKNAAIYLQSKNVTNVPDVITIEHPSLCGNHFEFSCITMCDENFHVCEDIFNSLVVECMDGTPIVTEDEETVTGIEDTVEEEIINETIN